MVLWDFRTLLCRPLPVDIGKCTCVIIKEAAEGASEGTLFSLYTNVSFAGNPAFREFDCAMKATLTCVRACVRLISSVR